MHVWNYLHPCLASKFMGVHILSCVQARVKSKAPEPHTSTSKFIGMHILLRVITSTQATRKLLKERY